ncbi:MAG TPA: hypothetical protein VK875_02510 [Euzebyales bacterium]|nr:hypothetical protein [Euzebyales bacterium]
MTKASPEDQRRLLELQATDTAIRQLRYRRGNLEEQRALDERAGLLDRITADHMASSDELVAVDRRHKRLENEISTIDARRKAEEARMYSGVIASEREVQALRSELSTLKTRKRDLEDDLLEVMERQEELTSAVQTQERRRAELQTEIAPLEKARDEAATEIDGDLAARQAARAELAHQLPDDLVRRYDELRARKDGVAVVELRDGTCQGCFLELTPGELQEGRELGVYGLARCVQCGRLLVEG